MADLSLIGMAAALLAGAISFISPCVLPLVPGYVSYIAGRSAGGGVQPGRSQVVPSGQLAPPPCPAASRLPPLHWVQGCQHDGSAKDDIRASAVTGSRCRSIIAETPSQPAQLDDDPTVRPLPSFPAPIPAASMMAWQRSVETRGRPAALLRMPRRTLHSECCGRLPAPAKCKNPPTKPPEGAKGSGIVSQPAPRPRQSIALKISPVSG